MAAWLRDVRVVVLALVLAVPIASLLPQLFPDRATDDAQRLLDALTFGAAIVAALWLSRRLVAAWDRWRARAPR